MALMKNEIKSLLWPSVHLQQRLEDMMDETGSLEELRNALIQQVNFYREENAKMEAVLKKLQLLQHELNPQSKAELETLTALQERYDTKQCSSEAIGLSHADRLRKQTNYATKQKSCIKMYNCLIEKLSKEIKLAKSELERSEKKVTGIAPLSSDDIKMLQVKIDRYEKELSKFEKKYPWLADSQYKLQNIAKETEVLHNLREEKAKLLQELDVYQGLKPDLHEARQQLTDAKHEYESLK